MARDSMTSPSAVSPPQHSDSPARDPIRPPPGADPNGIVLTFPVPPEQAGLRLDRFIQIRIPRLSRTRAKEVVQSCAFRRDGTRRRASERVREGEVVMLVRPSFDEPDTPQEFGVLYEDASVLGVDKPAGLPMHPTATYHRNTLTYLLRVRYPNQVPHIAHRLDRETSGVVLCGKHRDAERGLKQAFERRQVAKRYRAVVRGVVADDEGVIDQPLGGAPGGPHFLMAVRADGSVARTRYVVCARKRAATLLELHPETGRQHQLRVHLASIGHPIVGDKLYGPEGASPFFECIERGLTPDLVAALGHHRQALHAYSVECVHPDTRELLRVVAPWPEDLRALWDGQ